MSNQQTTAVRLLWPRLRPWRWQLLGCAFLVVTGAGLGTLFPILQRDIINHGILARRPALVVWLCVLALLAAAGSALAAFLGGIWAQRIGSRLVRNLRTELFEHALGVPFQTVTNKQVNWISHITADSSLVQQTVATVIPSLIPNLVNALVALAGVFALSALSGSYLVLLAPLLVLGGRRLVRHIKRASNQMLEATSVLIRHAQERLSPFGNVLVRLSGRREDERARFYRHADEISDASVRQSRYTQQLVAILTSVGSSTNILVYGVGGFFVARGQLDLGTVVGVAALMGRFVGPISTLSTAQASLASSAVALQRIASVLSAPTAAAADRSAEPGPGRCLLLDRARFDYTGPLETGSERSVDKAFSLQEVTLRIPAGSFVGIVGPSGSGKSTMLTLLAGMLHPTSGRVRLGQVDLDQIDPRHLPNVVGLAQQEAVLFSGTILDNVRYAAPDIEVSVATAALHAAGGADLIDGLAEGIHTDIGEGGARLSGGERQRVALARLFVQRPSVMLLDEVTAHMDPQTETAVLRALHNKFSDCTRILVTHRIANVASADFIAVLRDGQLVELGTHRQLSQRHGEYARLLGTHDSPGGVYD